MPKEVDHYLILGVERTASEDEIRKAFKRAALLAHPDKGGSNEEFQALARAYEILGDRERRERYDKFGFDEDDDDMKDVDDMTLDEQIAFYLSKFKDILKETEISAADVESYMVERENQAKERDSGLVEEDERQLKEYYLKFQGKISKIMQCVLCDKKSAVKFLSDQVERGDLPEFPAFNPKPGNQSKRTKSEQQKTQKKPKPNASKRKKTQA